MSKWRSAWRTALYDARLIIFSSRFAMLSVVAFIFMDLMMRPIRDFAGIYNLKVVPAVLPFYLTNTTFGNLAFLLLILLFSDIPLKAGAQKFLLQRGKSLVWAGTGHVLALWLAGAAFMLEQLLFSVLTALPDIQFGDWGKVWGSAASSRANELGYNGPGISDEVLRMYGPWQAVGLAVLLFLLTGCIYAEIEYMLNGLSRGRLGTAALSVWSVLWILLDHFPVPAVRRLLAWSPQTWNDLSRLTPGGALRQAGGLAVAVLALSAVAVFLVKRRKIEMVK